MKLLEHQAKAIFSHDDGIPVPDGWVVETPESARLAASALGGPVVVKAQVSVGRRGKAGGIKFAHDPEEAGAMAAQVLGMEIKGLRVRQVLVEKALDIAQELYLGVTLNRERQCFVAMASAQGGVDIEEVAERSPESIAQVDLDPFVGLRDYHARWLAKGIGLPDDLWPGFLSIVRALYDCLLARDATLAEINPLAITREGTLVAADAKMVIDDNALFRQPELAPWAGDELSEAERQARDEGLSYIKLQGEIGCMVNGAGLAMATMDLINLMGASPANFLDIGGGARGEKVTTALRILLSDAQVRAVLINIFGGITRCDEVARGIVQALASLKPAVPVVVRLTGTNDQAGQRILQEAGVPTALALSEAVRQAVDAARCGQVGAGEP